MYGCISTWAAQVAGADGHVDGLSEYCLTVKLYCDKQAASQTGSF